MQARPPRHAGPPAARRRDRLRPVGLLRRRAPAGAGAPRGPGRHVRPPADPVRPGARRRRPRPPEDQVGHPRVRQDRRPPRVPLLRERRDGPRPHPRRPAGLLPRDHLRGRRAHRPADGHPPRAPARQPLGHRVRRLVQRPPRLPPPRLRPPRERRRWSATATWRWTSPASSPARRRSSPRPTSPSTPSRQLAESRIREIHVLGRRGPAQAAFTNKELKELGELPDVDVVVDPAELALDPERRGAPAAAPNRTRDRNLEILREFAARAADRGARADPPPLPGLAGGDHRHASGSRRLGIVHNELYETEDGCIRPQRHRPAHHPPAGAGVPRDRLPGGAAAGDPLRRDARRHPQPGAAGSSTPHRRPGGGRVRGRVDQARPRGIIGTNKPDAQETVRMLLDDLARAPPQGGRADPGGARAAAGRAPPGLRLLRRLAADRPARAGARARLGRPAAGQVQPRGGDAPRPAGAQARGRRGGGGRPARGPGRGAGAPIRS